MGAKLSCLLKGTSERQQIKDLLHEYAAQSIGIEGKDFTFDKAYKLLRDDAGIEIDIESAAVLYMEEFDTTDSWFSTDEEIEKRAGVIFAKNLSKIAKAQPFTDTITIGDRSPGSAAADTIMKFFADMASPKLGAPSTMKLFQDKMTKAAKSFINKDVNIDSRIEAINKLINELESLPTPNDPIIFQDRQKRLTELGNMKYNAEVVDKNRIRQEAEIASKQAEADALMQTYNSTNDPDVKKELDKKREEVRDLIKAKKEFADRHQKAKVEDNFRMILHEAFLMNKRGYMNEDGPIAVLNSAKDVVEEFKIEMNEYVQQSLDSGDLNTVQAAQLEQYTDEIINQTYDLLLSNKEASKIVKDALRVAGFEKEITSNGQKKKVFDWTKLTDAANDTNYLKQQVIAALRNPEYNAARPFTDSEIDVISNALAREFDALKTDIIEKRVKELANQNKIRLSPEQSSKAKQLVKLYNMGWFESDPSKYDKILNDIIGLSEIDKETFNDLERLGKALNELYRNSRESDQFVKSAINNINEQIAQLINKNAKEKDKMFKIARWFQSFMSYKLRAALYTPSNAGIANNFSGWIARYRNYVYTNYFNKIENTKGVKGKVNKKGAIITDPNTGLPVDDKLLNYYDPTTAFNEYMADIIRQDISFYGGLQYGDLSSTFIVRGDADAFLNKTIDKKKNAKIFHGILSASNGRFLLDGQDSYFKYRITSTIFIRNFVKILSHTKETDFIQSVKKKYKEELNSDITSTKKEAEAKVEAEINLNKKKRLEEHRENSIIEINEKLYGQSFEDTLIAAKETIDKANKAAGMKVLPDNNVAVARLAGDMVKQNLLQLKNIEKEHILAAYNSAYKTAGYELGHVANNIISKGIQGINSFLSRKEEEAKKEDLSRAWQWSGVHTIYNTMANPFAGGGTNWVVNKINGLGIGMIRSSMGSKKTIEDISDITTDKGLADLEKYLYNENINTSLFVQGAMGALANIVMLSMGLAAAAAYFKSDDDEEDDEPLYSKYSKVYNLIEKNKKYKKFIKELYINYFTYWYTLHNANLDSQKEDETNIDYIYRLLNNSKKFVINAGDEIVTDALGLEYERYTYQSMYNQYLKYKKEGETANAAGVRGEMLGKTFSHPIPILRMFEQIKDTWKRDADYSKSMSYMHGFFKSGAFNTFGNREANINPLTAFGGTPFYLGMPNYELTTLPGIGKGAIKGLKDMKIDNMNDLKNYIIDQNGMDNISSTLRGIKVKDKADRNMPVFSEEESHIVEEIIQNDNKPVKLLSTLPFTEEQMKILKLNKIFTMSQLFDRSNDFYDFSDMNLTEDQVEEIQQELNKYVESVNK